MFSRVFLSAVLVVSGPVSAVAAEGNKWAPYVDVEGKLGTDRNLGEVGLFVPFGQSQDSLLFGNLITRFDDQDSFEGNVGLGYREIVDGSYILGGYAYFDRRKSASDNYFNQVMAGAEFMTDVWTVRANGYLADNDLAPTSGGVVTQSGTQIFVQSNLEGALSGFDAEVGRVIPLGLEDVTLTGFAGGFHFGRSGFDDVSGPRGRAELTVANLWDDVLPSGTQLRFGAEVQHDDVRDTQGFVSARLRVPLFGGSSSSNLSVLEQRMVDPVVRDIDVVAGGTLSAPVAPTLESNGTTIQAANVIDANDDLGIALRDAGPNSLVVIDGTLGVITSASAANVQPGQTVIGAENSEIILRDESTGAVITWDPAPAGTRPTLDGVDLGAASSSHISGLTMKDSFLVARGSPTVVVFPGLSQTVGGPIRSFSLDDIHFTGTYDLGATTGGIFGAPPNRAILELDIVEDVQISNVSFDGIAYDPGVGFFTGPVSGLSVVEGTNVSLSNVSMNNVASTFGYSTNFSAIRVSSSVGTSLSGVQIDDVREGSIPFPVILGLPNEYLLAGITFSGSTESKLENVTISNLDSTNINGTADTRGIVLTGDTQVDISNSSISGLTENGTNAAETVGIAIEPVASGANTIVNLDLTSFGSLDRSIEFNGGLANSMSTVSGDGNVLGAGVGGCINNAPAQVTVTGSISFTNGSTCP